MEFHKILKGGKVRYIILDSNMKLVKPVNQYLDYQQLRGRSENTMRAYGQDLKTYFLFLEQENLSYKDVDASVIQKYIEYLRSPNNKIIFLMAESSRTASTINRMIGTVYGFYCYHFAVNKLDNPVSTIQKDLPVIFKDIFYHTRKSNRTKNSIFTVKQSGYKVHIFTLDEIEKMYSVLPTTRDRLIFKVLLHTGARISEVLSLKIEDIPVPDFSNTITILQDITSKGKSRNIYVPTELVSEIDNYLFEERLKLKVNHSYIFVSQHPHQKSRPISYRGIYEVFKLAGVKVGIDFKFHDTRHTYITKLVESGMDFSVVRILAGHEHISTTEKYVTLSTKFITEHLSEYWKHVSSDGGDDSE